jgi:hypothetical protein
MMTWESVLYVKNVDAGDYGAYKCNARNELGDETHIVRLDVTSVPEPPIGLKVLNFTHDSVTLTWLAGFNGGYDQSYKLKYWKVGTDHYRYEDVSPRNSTIFTVTNLALGTDYAFSILGVNYLGEGNYTTEIVQQETSSKFTIQKLLLGTALLVTLHRTS